VAYNFQTEINKIKLPTEYENVTQNVLFGNAVLVALMSGRKYDVIPQNGDKLKLGIVAAIERVNAAKTGEHLEGNRKPRQ
jgi:hypothetical protein